MPEPFDWEELTNENWPLPITPPTEEEMRQRLQKQIKAHRIKMKSQSPGKLGSSLTNDSRNTDQKALLDNNTQQDSTLRDGSVQANVAFAKSIEGENLTASKEDKPIGFLQSDNSLIGSFAKNGRIMNKTDVQHNSVDTIQDINPIKSETRQSWLKENPVNYTSQELNDTRYTSSQLSGYLQSVNDSQSIKDNNNNLYYNLQNPDYLNIRQDNPGSPSENQDRSNHEIAFSNGSKPDSAFTSDDTISKNANDSSTQGLVKQEMKQQIYSESSGYDLNNLSKLKKQNYSSSDALTNNGSTTTDSLKSDQSRIAEYYNLTLVASLPYKNLSLYGNFKTNVAGNTTTLTRLLDQNQFVNSPYQTTESIANLSDSTVSVIANESFDRNPEYNSNRSFASLAGGQSLHQNWSDTAIPTNVLIFPIDNPRYGNRSISDAMNETTVQIGVDLNGKQTSENLTASYPANAGSTSSRMRNNSLITNLTATAPYLSTKNQRPDYLNQDKATNDSFNNGSYAPTSNQGNSSLSALIIFSNETSAQLSNMKSDHNWNLYYKYLNNSVGEIANTTTADNIRSNQYWNPGYENSDGKQSNESSLNSEEIRSDLYWNPGYANNRSITLQSNESKLNPQSYYLQSLNLYWNRSSVLETFDRSTNGTSDALRIVKENYSSSDVVVVLNSTSTNRSEDVALPHLDTFNRSANATLNNSKSNDGTYAGTQNISAGIQSSSVGNQSVSSSSYTISKSNESNSADIQSIHASIYGASAGNQSVVASSKNLSASNEQMPAGTQSFSSGNPSISAGSIYSISSYDISDTSGSTKNSIINGSKVKSNTTAMANESNSLLRNADTFYKQANDTSKAGPNKIARTELIGRRHNLLPEKHENPFHSKVRMILKNWSKITNSDNAEDNMMKKNTAKGATTGKDASFTKTNGAAGKDVSNKDLERDGLFVKPGLNIGTLI